MATINDVRAILHRAATLYPRLELKDPDSQSAEWLRILRGFDAKIIAQALDDYAAENSRQPHVSDIRKICERKSPRPEIPATAADELKSIQYRKALGLKKITDLFQKEPNGKNFTYYDKPDPRRHIRIRTKNGRSAIVLKIDFCMAVFGPRKVTRWLRDELGELRDMTGDKKKAAAYLDWLEAVTIQAKEQQQITKQVRESF